LVLEATESPAAQSPIGAGHEPESAARAPRALIREAAITPDSGALLGSGALESDDPARPPSTPRPMGTDFRVDRAAVPARADSVPVQTFVEPPPLLPPACTAASATPSAARHTAALPQLRAGAGGEDTTEVHIHIGRIEVTAAHETPRARAEPRSKQAPMSLGAYLAARGKR
jgi:hypothetical protein